MQGAIIKLAPKIGVIEASEMQIASLKICERIWEYLASGGHYLFSHNIMDKSWPWKLVKWVCTSKMRDLSTNEYCSCQARLMENNYFNKIWKKNKMNKRNCQMSTSIE